MPFWNLSMRRDLNPHAKGSCIWSNRVCQFHHSWLNHSLIFNEQPMLLDPRFLVYPLGMTGTCSLISSSNKSSVLPSSEISRWVDSNHQPRNFKFPCSAVGIHRVKVTIRKFASQLVLARTMTVEKHLMAVEEGIEPPVAFATDYLLHWFPIVVWTISSSHFWEHPL